MAQSDLLVWIDLETTGLDPVKDEIIEVAAIVTDGELNERADFSVCVHPSLFFGELHPVVQRMHRASGLASRLWDPEGDPLPRSVSSTLRVSAADAALAGFIVKHCDLTDEKQMAIRCGMPDARAVLPQAAGSTIGFDREFMRNHLPQSLALLSHRSLDVTALNELARRRWPAIYQARPRGRGLHRATDDIRDSLEVARYYAQALGPVA